MNTNLKTPAVSCLVAIRVHSCSFVVGRFVNKADQHGETGWEVGWKSGGFGQRHFIWGLAGGLGFFLRLHGRRWKSHRLLSPMSGGLEQFH